MFNRVINENDGSSMVCVSFMDDSTVMVQGTLTTANSTAIGIDLYFFIILLQHVPFILSLA